MKSFVTLLLLLAFTSGLGIVKPQNPTAPSSCKADRDERVAHALAEMKSIKVGMTRKQLLETLTTEGGISTRLNHTYVSRECPYFKIDVEFQAGGRIERDKEGRLSTAEDDQDIVVKISRPYLDYSVAD